jgi:hypothetical protein
MNFCTAAPGAFLFRLKILGSLRCLDCGGEAEHFTLRWGKINGGKFHTIIEVPTGFLASVGAFVGGAGVLS